MGVKLGKPNIIIFYGLLLLVCAAVSCGRDEAYSSEDRLWEYACENPFGFTVNVIDWTIPSEGISVAYLETQDSHGREGLRKSLGHALSHDGYVGGWLSDDGSYYFDSVKLFPEDMLEQAKEFGRQNLQIAIYILSKDSTVYLDY